MTPHADATEADTAHDSPRADLALCVTGAARAHGWSLPPATAFAIADAVLARPGLLRAALRAAQRD